MTFYQSHLGLTDVPTKSEQFKLCRRLEIKKNYIENIKNPPSKNFIYWSPIWPTSSSCSVICHRCNKPGHIQSLCESKAQSKCFKCNKLNYTIRSYPNCNRENPKNVPTLGRVTNLFFRFL